LLKGKKLMLNETYLQYFFYLIKYMYKIPLTIEPSKGNCVLGNLNYANMWRISTLQDIHENMRLT
jgi:hypothetical protein